ncbi:squamosa promoter-binding-like protein 12 [Tanacetum coccineum]
MPRTSGTHDDEAGSSSRSKRTRVTESMEEVMLSRVHHEFLLWRTCNKTIKSRYNTNLARILPKQVYSPCIVDWTMLNTLGYGNVIEEMLDIKVYEIGGDEVLFNSKAWRRAFNINEPIYTELCHGFYATYEFNEEVLDDELTSKKLIKFRLGGRAHSLIILEFARRLGLYTNDEIQDDGFETYFHRGYDKVQRNELWLMSMFRAKNREGYANIAKRIWVLTEDVPKGLSALTYRRPLDATTLREMIGSNERLIAEDLAPAVPYGHVYWSFRAYVMILWSSITGRLCTLSYEEQQEQDEEYAPGGPGLLSTPNSSAFPLTFPPDVPLTLTVKIVTGSGASHLGDARTFEGDSKWANWSVKKGFGIFRKMRRRDEVNDDMVVGLVETSLPVVARLGFLVVTVGFVEDVEIVVEVVVVRIVVDSIVLVSYKLNIGYQTGDIVRTRLNVEMKMLWDLKKMMSLGFKTSRDMEWNTKWDWENLAMFGSKGVASPKKLQATDWVIREGQDIDGSSNLSGVVGGSGGSGSISASTESSFKDTTKVTKFSVDFGGGELNKSSPSLEASVCSSDQSIGLKLGKRTYFENNLPRSNSCASTVKKAKLSQQNAPIICQVMGCDRDLASAKDYHRKHRVCDIHSKALKVIVAGLERRFHGLPEFDGKKRSCRKRLADHNARRRKPHQETIQFNSRSMASSYYDGPRQLSFAFNNGPVVQTKPAVSSMWENTCNSKHSVATVKAEKYGGHDVLTHSQGVQFPNPVSMAPTLSFNRNMPSKGTTAGVFDQGSNLELRRALSLLSNNSWGSSESDFGGLDHPMHTNGPNIAQQGMHSAPHGLPLLSPEYWQVDQQSVDPHIHGNHFQGSHILKAPYGIPYVNPMDEIVQPL